MAATQIKKEESQVVGVYQLKNGLWAYRFIVKINGEQKTQRRSKDEEGKPFRTQKQAARAREKALKKIQAEANTEIVNANKRCDEINKIIRKLYEDNINGRITDERFDYLSKSYEEEQNELNRKVQELKEILAVVDNDNEKLTKFIRIVKQYTEIEELTPDILHSFVDRIYIGETEVYEGQKFQDIKIVYNLVGAIDLPQYAM